MTQIPKSLDKEILINTIRHLRSGIISEQQAQQVFGRYEKEKLLEFLSLMIENVELDWQIAAYGIPYINQEKGIPALIKLSAHENPTVRCAMCGYIGNYDDPRGIDTLVERLEDTDSAVRAVAIFSLGKIGDERAIVHLQKVAQQDTYEDYEGRKNKDEALQSVAMIQKRLWGITTPRIPLPRTSSGATTSGNIAEDFSNIPLPE